MTLAWWGRSGANWVIRVGYILLFNFVHWITLQPSAPNKSFWQTLLVAAVIGLLFTMVQEVVRALSMLACFLSIIVYILAGYLTLLIIANLSPGFLAIQGGNGWAALLVGLIMTFAVVPSLRRRTTANRVQPPRSGDGGDPSHPPVMHGRYTD